VEKTDNPLEEKEVYRPYSHPLRLPSLPNKTLFSHPPTPSPPHTSTPPPDYPPLNSTSPTTTTPGRIRPVPRELQQRDLGRVLLGVVHVLPVVPEARADGAAGDGDLLGEGGVSFWGGWCGEGEEGGGDCGF
jgi:hypothetical protein